jgi:predicted membrane channel-forming protein YqfA (hemolysin III family)
VIAAINTDGLLELMWAAPLAVLAVTVSWGLVVIGTTRAAEARRDGRVARAGAYVAMATAGAALFTAAVVFGLLVMISKD